MKPLIKGSEPFFRKGQGQNGRTGCLLIHGFTGTPFEMLGLGDHLAAAGYTVLGPRLTHHGTTAADMNRSRWSDWYYAALDGWHLLNQISERVVVIGLSMGGVTALLLAANNPVAAVITMSAPAVFMPRQRQLNLARYIWRLKPLLDKPNTAPEKTAEHWPSYPHIPVRAAVELLDYRAAMAAALPAITAPALLLHALDDETVPLENLDYIFNHLGSAVKNRILLERGGHVMTEGSEKEQVFHEIVAFLAGLDT